MNPLELQIRTVIWMLAIGNFTALLTLVAYASGKAHGRTYKQFVASKLLQTIAWGLLEFRDQIPDILSADLGNTLLISGFALESLALTTTSKPNRKRELTYGITATLGILAFVFFAKTPNLRVSIASMVNMVLFGMASVTMLRTPAKSSLRKAIGVFLGVFSTMLGIRASMAFYLPHQFGLLYTHPVQTLSFVPVYLMIVVGGIGFLLMLKENDDKQLNESEERYRTLVEKAQEAVIIVQDGLVVFANAQSSQLLGARPTPLLGSSFFDLVFPQGREQSFPQDGRQESSVSTDSYDARIDDGSGKSTWVFVSTSSIHWEGKPAKFCILMNISERKSQEEERERMIAALQKALAENKTLSGLLPICASCKKIRDNKGYWNQVEKYIEEHSAAEFSHSICPQCCKKLYPEYSADVDDSPQSSRT